MQEVDAPANLRGTGWDMAIVGKALDDRGTAVTAFLSSDSTETLELLYDPDTFLLSLGHDLVQADEFDTAVEQYRNRSIVLEATTLGFVEVFLTLKALSSLKVSKVDLLYAEPGNYNLKRTSLIRTSQLLHRRDFELSDEVPGYKAIPTATKLLTDQRPQKTVFFLGFEERRIERALEDHQLIQPSNTDVVFGVPAYRPGWEMDAFANNVRVIKERKLEGGVHFCGAENPAAALEVLQRIQKGLITGEVMFIAPIGTKPMGIGAALFAATEPNVGLLYDHPTRKPKRSSDVGRWHMFSVTF